MDSSQFSLSKHVSPLSVVTNDQFITNIRRDSVTAELDLKGGVATLDVHPTSPFDESSRKHRCELTNLLEEYEYHASAAATIVKDLSNRWPLWISTSASLVAKPSGYGSLDELTQPNEFLYYPRLSMKAGRIFWEIVRMNVMLGPEQEQS